MSQAPARVPRAYDDEHRARRAELRAVEDDPPRIAGERRTVRITGHPDRPPPRRRTVESQLGGRPDRIAKWAVLLGVFLVAIAAATARAAEPADDRPAASGETSRLPAGY